MKVTVMNKDSKPLAFTIHGLKVWCPFGAWGGVTTAGDRDKGLLDISILIIFISFSELGGLSHKLNGLG